MAYVSEVADSIFRIVPEPSKRGIPCECYLVVDERLALIETGSASQIPDILAGMAELGYDAASLSYIIPTHIHADHGGGVGYLLTQGTQAQVVVYERGSQHLIDPSKLIKMTRKVFGENFEEEFGPLLPVPEAQVFSVQGDETITLGQRSLKIIHAPGHAPHHICIYDSKSEGLFSGEALGCYVPEDDRLMLAVAPPIFELSLALDTIQRLKQLNPKMLFFSQWGVSHKALRLIEQYVEYIKTCGDIILANMRAGESEKTILQKIQPYVKESGYVASDSIKNTFKTFWVSPFAVYFKKEGLI
jgi:glyoxylase-like metal-dependent hydrolase (beta-lactamase superfamily II)